jgi:UDP-N-acetylmuramoyl-tripeptide--D-alanyl-D-alanine ligase
MTAGDIARRAGGEVAGDPDARADNWTFDSRVLSPGSCFVALRGARDGHDFVPDALAGGATVVVVDHQPAPFAATDLGPGRAFVRTPDTMVALQQVARSLRAERADLRVVAVAGSTGKTSTKDLLGAALASRGCYTNAESFNNEFGLPLTLCNAPAAAGVVVTEMGERFPGDLALLCAIAQPTVGVVTNVGIAHAEYLGGADGTVAVLSELLDALPATGVAVLNADDPYTPALASATRAEVIRVGYAAGADYRIAATVVDDRLRPSFTVNGNSYSVPLHGAHHAHNAAFAIAVAERVFSLAPAEIATELAGAVGSKWRMELLETDDGVVVLNDAYNANPTSVDAALVALAGLSVAGRRIAVLGDMRELGAHHADAHGTIGTRARELGVDVVVGVGDGGALIARAANAATIVADANAAIALLQDLVAPGDAVLVKGSRALGLERVADALLARGRTRCSGGERA